VIILRPGTEAFAPEWLFAVAAAVALSVRDLSTRAVPRGVSTVQIAGWGACAVLATGLVLQLASGAGLPAVGAGDLGRFALASACLGAGIFAVSAAMRMGEVAVVAPFRYTRLPFGLLVGVAFFGEGLDAPMLFGAAIIVASGLYVFLRERLAAGRS